MNEIDVTVSETALPQVIITEKIDSIDVELPNIQADITTLTIDPHTTGNIAPRGGIEGQYLRKRSELDFDFSWQDADLPQGAMNEIYITVGYSDTKAKYVVTDTIDNALEEAIAESLANNYRPVYIMEGEYTMENVVFDFSNIHIRGAGKNKTIIKRISDNSGTTMYIGNSTGPTLRENIQIEDITFDYNDTGSGFLLGVSWAKDVYIKDCSFINPSGDAKSLLMLGKFSNGDDNYEAKNFNIINCEFDFGGVSYAWEGIGVIYARDVKFINCSIKNKPVTAALLNYQSQLVRIINCYVEDAFIMHSGYAPTLNHGNIFINAYIKMWGSDQDIIKNNLFWQIGDHSGKTCGVRYQGNRYTEGGSENPYFMGTTPYDLPHEWECKSARVEGNKFIGCTSNAISGTIDNDDGIDVLAINSIDISNNEFDDTKRAAINVVGRRVIIENNNFSNSNTLTGNSSAYHIRTAGEYVRIHNNTFGGSDNITRDIVVDHTTYSNWFDNTTIWLGHNKYSEGSVSRIQYYTGSTYTGIIQSGIELKIQGTNTRVKPEDFGFVGDGETDNSEAWGRLHQYAEDNNGLIVEWEAKAYAWDEAIWPKNNLNADNPKQAPIHHIGLSNFDGQWQDIPDKGTRWISRYNGDDGAHPAKFNSYGAGHLRLEGITFLAQDDDTDNHPFFFTGYTTVRISSCMFMGSPTKNLVTCDQDAIILGYDGVDGIFGLSDTVNGIGNKENFQGYGSIIEHCQFHKVRAIVTWGNDCNGITVMNLTTSRSCGSNDTTYGAPFVFKAADRHGASGNLIMGGTIEIKGYRWVFYFGENVWTPALSQPSPYLPTADYQYTSGDEIMSEWDEYDAIYFLAGADSSGSEVVVDTNHTVTLPPTTGNVGKIVRLGRKDSGDGLYTIAAPSGVTINYLAETDTNLAENTLNYQSRWIAFQVNSDGDYDQIDARSGTYRQNVIAWVNVFDDHSVPGFGDGTYTKGFAHFAHNATGNYIQMGFSSETVQAWNPDPETTYTENVGISGGPSGNNNEYWTMTDYEPSYKFNPVRFSNIQARVITTVTKRDTNGSSLDILTGSGSNAINFQASKVQFKSGDDSPQNVMDITFSETTGASMNGPVRVYNILRGSKVLTATATTTVDWHSFNYYKISLAVNATTVDFTVPQSDKELLLKIQQTAGGSHTFAWPANVKFPGGAPTLSTTNGAVDIFRGIYDVNDDVYYFTKETTYS